MVHVQHIEIRPFLLTSMQSLAQGLSLMNSSGQGITVSVRINAQYSLVPYLFIYDLVR